jgi:putative SOS response-associated peptidase YedK
MCGRFAQQRPASELAEIFGAEPLVTDAGDHYNVAPTNDAMVVVEKEGRRAVTAYRWGLIPHWAEDRSIGQRMINARAETLARSSAYRDSFRRRRCLVPVDAFYEWRREGNVRLPYVIRHEDGSPLALAGLWSGWRDPETEEVVRTFTIVTTGANELVASIHDRMPVIVPPERWATWLDPALADTAELNGLLVPADPEGMEAYEVSRRVNSVRNDGPELLVPIDD